MDGQTVDGTFTTEEDNLDIPPELEESDFTDFDPNDLSEGRQKFYVDEGEVSIVAESVQILDQYGKLRTIQFTQYTKEQINTMFTNAHEFKTAWLNIKTRNEIIQKLEESGISFDQLEDITQIKESDYFDLLCHVAYGLKPLTRKQRAEQVKKAEKLQVYSEKAQEIIELIIDKYIEFGAKELTPNIIQVHPISEKGNVMEIVNEFGGIDEFKKILNEIQQLLYAA